MGRFAPNREGAYGSAGTAILVFLGILFGAAVLSLHLLFVTIQAYPSISLLLRLAGIGPSVVLIAALAMLLGVLRY